MTAATAQDAGHATGGMSARPHFGGFEALRAVAALMVVVHHGSSIVTGLTDIPRRGTLERFAAVFDSGVAVFFVLSGFLLWWPFVDRSLRGIRPEPILGFWWRRILRIVPAYWLALTVFALLGIVRVGDAPLRYYLFLQVYSKETILGGIVVAWSLCTEIAFYAALPLLGRAADRLVRGRDPRAGVRLHLVFCSILWLTGLGSRIAVDRWWPDQRGLAFTWLPQNLDLFATGMALAVLSVAAMHLPGLHDRLDRRTRRTWPWWTAAAALFSWYALRVGPADFAVGYRGWFWHQRQILLGVVTLLLLLPVVFGTRHGGPLRRLATSGPVVWIGLVSYGLYLWHLDTMRELVDRDVLGLRTLLLRGSGADPAIVVLAVVGAAAGLALAAISWYGLERPLQRFRRLGRLGRLGRH